MGAAGAKYRQIRFDIKDGFTETYVLMDAIGDCPLGVQGWHYKVFPKDLSCLDILTEIGKGGDGDPVLWPQKAPDGIA